MTPPGPIPPPVPGDPLRIRKQVYLLTLSDLEAHPVWEHASDEEDLEDQDEATVRPHPSPLASEPGLIVPALLTAADGTMLHGYAYTAADFSIEQVQPYAITPHGHAGFWFGVLEPHPSDLEELYRVLGKTAATLFPLKVQLSCPPATTALEGTIDGFCRRRGLRSQTILTFR